MDDHSKPRLNIGTLAAQALGVHEPQSMGLVPPIHMATTFLRDADNGYRTGRVYGRADNPTVQHAQDVIAALESGSDALLFGSGMAAATTVFLALPGPTHIIAPDVMYWGLRSWLRQIGNHGHSVDFVDMSDLDQIRRALRPGHTGVIWVETPSNPLWTLTDIEAVADMARSVDAMLCVDSTVSSPILTRPLELGADIVMHSATKYLNGHSDVIAGALATSLRTEFWSRIKAVRTRLGAGIGPFDAWLLTRGMRTLEVRVRMQSRTAARLAHDLVGHPAIRDVLYPGLASHSGHAIACRQMDGGFGGMLSIRIRAGEAAAIRIAGRVRLWNRATSLGGVESLIEHRASIEGDESPCPPDLLRLSVGLEHADDLYADLLQAMLPET